MSVTLPTLQLPEPPADAEAAPQWARNLNDALRRYTDELDEALRTALVHRIITGPLTDRPEAAGTGCLWIDTGNARIYVDIGSWVEPDLSGYVAIGTGYQIIQGNVTGDAVYWRLTE